MQAGERVLARYLQRYMTGTRQTAAKAYYELARQPQRVSWRGAFIAQTPEKTAPPLATESGAMPDEMRKKPPTPGDTFRRSHAFSAQNANCSMNILPSSWPVTVSSPNMTSANVLASEFAINGMVNAAIAHQRWEEVLYWINRVSNLEAGKSRNQYWLARAAAATGPTPLVCRTRDATRLLRIHGRGRSGQFAQISS